MKPGTIATATNCTYAAAERTGGKPVVIFAKSLMPRLYPALKITLQMCALYTNEMDVTTDETPTTTH